MLSHVSFVVVYLVGGGLKKDNDCSCCVYCILKWFAYFETQESQLSKDIWHVQLFVFWVFVSDNFTPTPLAEDACVTLAGLLQLQRDTGLGGRKDGMSLSCGREWGTRVWAGVSSLISVRCDPLPRCFFLVGPWEEGSGMVQGAESLSEKKAIHERREVRLISL